MQFEERSTEKILLSGDERWYVTNAIVCDEVVKVGRVYETYFASRPVESFEYIEKE